MKISTTTPFVQVSKVTNPRCMLLLSNVNSVLQLTKLKIEPTHVTFVGQTIYFISFILKPSIFFSSFLNSSFYSFRFTIVKWGIGGGIPIQT